ncbi:cysteine dioxygenase family protein [Algihabitans albus]|uniref:cysteine dioxygenase family protein n=1 Tax=Algihabitans albus TaxID=2164067 RepID=UPI000E5D0F8B|nr:cysteine dioxygenase family protein [Algihabitans albus]
MSNEIDARRTLTEDLLAKTRATLNQGALTREKLSVIKEDLHALSQKTELWREADYPAPNEGEQQNRFLIAQESGEGLSLYLNVMRPGKKIPPHNHTTWACIAAVEGAEHNTIYDRLDDGSVEGEAQLRSREMIELKPGHALALMPDDIHSVEIKGERPIRHLHFYGRPLETLTERVTFDVEAGTCRIMDIGVKTKA